MNTNKDIDEYIAREKSVKHTPFLQQQIMAKIGAEQKPVKITLRQRVAFAASITLVVAAGILIGNSYNNPQSNQYAAVNINDNNIERILDYNFSDDE